MKKIEFCKVLKNARLTEDVFDMVLESEDIYKECTAGQFIEMYVDNFKNILPRPFSICETYENKIRIIYLVKGEGTNVFSKLEPGEKVKILGPLGKGFNIADEKKIGIVGGGVGIPPLLYLAQTIIKKEKFEEINIILGFKDIPFLTEDFEKLAKDNIKIFISTDSGKFGYKGNCVSLIKESKMEFDIIYSCGPTPMLKAISEFAIEKNIKQQLSLEERMACGIGACIGCAVKIKNNDGYEFKKVCFDGPVFNGEEVIWND